MPAMHREGNSPLVKRFTNLIHTLGNYAIGMSVVADVEGFPFSRPIRRLFFFILLLRCFYSMF